MVSAVLAMLALVQQAPPADQPAILECSLVTPAGDTVNFGIPHWDENSGDITLVQGEATIWPTRTLPGQRGIMTGTPRAARMFAFGSGDGLALDIESGAPNRPLRGATLYRRDRQRAGLPLAFGFCRQETGRSYIYRQVDQNADPRQIGANIPAFDPANWPANDCGLALSDGRRVPFHFSLANSDQIRLSSPALWAGRPVTMDIRWGNIEGDQAGTFARRGGPEGLQIFVVDGSSAARMIWLRQIASSSGRALSGFGICGYSQIVRRPSP